MLVRCLFLKPRVQIKRVGDGKYFLGNLCKRGHFVIDVATGERLEDKSVRRVGSYSCIACEKTKRSANSLSRRHGDEIDLKKRHQRLDDIKAARELGITLEEYLG